MKKPITVYVTTDYEPRDKTIRVVRDGVVRYKNNNYLVFDKDGEASILADDPIRKPIDRIPDDEVVSAALNIVSKRVIRGPFMECPDAVKSLFILRHHGLKNEVFDVALLDNRHRLITIIRPFKGGPTSANVIPRVIVAEALRVNAQAVVYGHNHPNLTHPDPSRADVKITLKLKKLLDEFEIRSLDHIITSGKMACSFAERGEL